MARYKLIQNIEAEDHILGPLTLRQFIFALITAFCLYMSYISLVKAALHFLLVLFVPLAFLFGFLAFPWGRDQPTELWALAMARYLFKPRRRLWDQSGEKQLVTITAPKKEERQLTNNLSQTEVQGRLKALANTLDSRGWAIKGLNVNLYGYQNPALVTDSDRLIDLSSAAQVVPDYDVSPADDVFDAQGSPTYKQLDEMITDSEQKHRQSLIDKMTQASQMTADSSGGWFAQPVAQTTAPPEAASNEDQSLAKNLRDKSVTRNEANAKLRTLSTSTPVSDSQSPDNPAIISLSRRDDLNVSTIAREANKARQKSTTEVLVNLHKKQKS